MVNLKCTWELNEGLTWGDEEKFRYKDFVYADFKGSSESSLEGTNFLQTGGRLVLSGELVEDLTHSYLQRNKIVWEARGELFVSNMISETDFIGRLRNYLPWYEKDDPIFLEILKAYDAELRVIDVYKKLIERNVFVEGMEEALPYWERDFNIRGVRNLSLRQRREQVQARWTAQFGQLTREKLKQTIETFSNSECELISDYNECVVTISFVGTRGRPDNMEGLEEVLKMVLPAHWGYKFEFIYSPWEGLLEVFWKDLEPYEWGEIERWEDTLKRGSRE